MDDIYTQLATDYLNNQGSGDSSGQTTGQNVSPVGQVASPPAQNTSSSTQLAPDDVYENLAKDYLEKNPQAASTPTDNGQTAPLPDAAYTQLATEHLAQTGQLKKDDLDSYFDLVKAHALDPNYDPANQTAQDKVNGIDSRDYNFDIYNARYNQGFQTQTPFLESAWDAAKGFVPGVVHSLGDASFWNRLAESAYQKTPALLVPGAIPLENALGISVPELPSISGRSGTQNLAELAAATDVAKDQDWANLRPLGDNLTTSFKNLDDKEKNSYFDRRVNDQFNIEQAARGKGALTQGLGLGNDVKDVEGVKDAADFALLHPAQDALIAGSGFLGGLISKGAGVLAGSIIPQGLGEGVNGLVGNVSKIASKYATPGVVGALTTAEEYNRTGNLGDSIWRGIEAAGGEAAFKIQNRLSDFGDYMQGNAPEGYIPPMEVRMAQNIFNKAKDIASTPEFQTALGGAAYSMPFALAQDDPNKRKAVILNGLAAGTGLGTVSRLGGLLDARYNASTNADFYKNLPTNPSEYGTPYDAATNDAMKVATQDQRDLLYRNRNLLPGNSVQVYPVLDDQFESTALPRAQQFFQSKGYDSETATNLAKNSLAQGIYYSADANNVPQIFMRLSQFNPENLYHETGHFISDVVNSNISKAQADATLSLKNGQPISPETQSTLDMANQLEKSIPTGKARQTAENGYIDRLYNLDALQEQIDSVQKQAKTGDLQAQSHLDNLNQIKQEFQAVHENGLPDDVFKNEWLSDQFSLASRGLTSGKQAGFSHTISQGLGSFLDTIAPNAVSKYLTTRQTPLGFRPSFIAADIFDHWIEERAQAIKGAGSGWKPSVSANNAPTENPIEPQAVVEPTQEAPITQPPPDVIQGATDALTGLKAFGKKAVAGKVNDAIEALRNEGVDVSQVKLEDVVARALRGRGETPTSLVNAAQQKQPIPTPLPKVATNPPLQGIAPQQEPLAQPKPNLRGSLTQLPVTPQTSQILNPEGFIDTSTLAKEGHKNPNGLSVATHREVMPDLSINENPQSYLIGKAIDTSNPFEAAILKQALADSPNPAMLQTAVNVIQDAIAKGDTTNVAYDSAKNNLQSVPSAQNRSNNQSLADKGFLQRESVQKSINPTSIQAQTTEEPIFDGNSQATALKAADDFDYKGKRIYKNANDVKTDLLELYKSNQENRPPNLEPNETKYLLDNFVPSQLRTRLYSMNFSYDKSVGNIDLLSRTIVDSGLQKDPYWSKIYDYLNGSDIKNDIDTRLNNIANGHRGDGGVLQGITQKINPDVPGIPLDDFKTQVLNALEGGPARTFFKESNQNVPELRGIKVDPFNNAQGANPLYNKLTALGKKAKLFEKDASGNTVETNGINNILNDATEKIRLDRINSITSQAVKKPTSQYINRAIGFTPGTGVAPGIDATVNPTLRNFMPYLQGIAGASSELKSQ